MAEPVVGRRYSVSWDDCCVGGDFTATLVATRIDPRYAIEPEEDVIELQFDNGVTLTEWLGVTFGEVDDG